MNKTDLRKQIKLQKRNMSETQILRASKKLTELFLNSESYQSASSVYAYLPYNQEVRTEAIIRQALLDRKKVAVPKVYGDEMRFLYIQDLDHIAPGAFQIPEPIADDPVADDKTALVLMPGLAFDREGHRIGYGGGFYDRYLACEPNHPTIALCYDFQMVDHLETEAFDIPVDKVLWAEIGEKE